MTWKKLLFGVVPTLFITAFVTAQQTSTVNQGKPGLQGPWKVIVRAGDGGMGVVGDQMYTVSTCTQVGVTNTADANMTMTLSANTLYRIYATNTTCIKINGTLPTDCTGAVYVAGDPAVEALAFPAHPSDGANPLLYFITPSGTSTVSVCAMTPVYN